MNLQIELVTMDDRVSNTSPIIAPLRPRTRAQTGRGHSSLAKLRTTESVTPDKVDWSLLARPRPDSYDADVCLDRSGRSLRQDYPAPTLLAGCVALRETSPGICADKGWTQADLSHHHIDRALSLLRCWPSVHRQFGRLIDVFHPVLATEPGSARSMHIDHQRGHVWADISDPLRLAYALVRETAHTKLLDLGLEHSCDYQLVLNPLPCLFDIATIEGDGCGPMAELVHELLAASYQRALLCEILTLRPAQDLEAQMRADLAVMDELSTLNVARIANYGRFDADGDSFMADLYDWHERLVDEARHILQTTDAGGAQA